MDISHAAEDYCKAIYKLGKGERVSNQALSESLKVTPSSVGSMIKLLEREGLIDNKPYYGVKLTTAGERLAIELTRRHRLLELYLSKEHSYSLEEVHDEAEILEHGISEKFLDSIAHKLGNPTLDPHGSPIPKKPKKGSHE